jgi:hypothetical protein
VAKLLCSNLCLFGAIIELHVVDENLFNDSHWKVKVDFICDKGLYFKICVCSGGIYHDRSKRLL